jgi:hypothetical protein
MLYEQQRTISRRSNVREWTHVLLVNTPCLHQYNFWATGISSSLATRMTLARVSRRRLEESITWGWTCFYFIFVLWYVIVLACILNFIPCTYTFKLWNLCNIFAFHMHVFVYQRNSWVCDTRLRYQFIPPIFRCLQHSAETCLEKILSSKKLICQFPELILYRNKLCKNSMKRSPILKFKTSIFSSS